MRDFTDKPILIAMVGRSGSSMVTGIFHEHGMWTGPTRPPHINNPKGFFENLKLKSLLKNHHTVFKKEVALYNKDFRANVESIITKQGYTSGPWGYKFGSTYWTLWRDFTLAKWICIRRDTKCVFESLRAAKIGRDLDDDSLLRIIKFYELQLESIVDNFNGVNIYTDHLIQGDYTSLKRGIEHAGLEFDPKIADRFINKEYWHHESS